MKITIGLKSAGQIYTYGPFDDVIQASNWADHNLQGRVWYYVQSVSIT